MKNEKVLTGQTTTATSPPSTPPPPPPPPPPTTTTTTTTTTKGKGLPQQAEVAQVIPVRLKSRIFLMFGTTRVVGRQPYAPAAFTPGEIPGTHFQG